MAASEGFRATLLLSNGLRGSVYRVRLRWLMLSFNWSISNSMYRLLQKTHFDSLCSLGQGTGLENGNGTVFYIYVMQKAGAFKTRAHPVRRFNILTRVPFHKQYLCHGMDSIFVKMAQHPALSRSVKSITSWIYMYPGLHKTSKWSFKYFMQPSSVPELLSLALC